MNDWARTTVTKYVNVGTPLVLMGALWLYLWVFPWHEAYVYDPRWGHNYAEALAFLAVGLTYFNRRLISDVLAFLAAALIIPASLELLPHPVTAIAGGVLVALIILDMIVEPVVQSVSGETSYVLERPLAPLRLHHVGSCFDHLFSGAPARSHL